MTQRKLESKRWRQGPGYKPTKTKPETRRKSKLKSKYGLTPESVSDLRRSQGDLCAICSSELGSGPHIDHDHATGLVRGMLCRACNLGLGFFKDDIRLLDSARAYLTKPPAQL